MTSILEFLECPKCGSTNTGVPTCCGKGGSWQGKCGRNGDTRFEHTWGEGERACSTIVTPQLTTPKLTTTRITTTMHMVTKTGKRPLHTSEI